MVLQWYHSRTRRVGHYHLIIRWPQTWHLQIPDWRGHCIQRWHQGARVL